MKKVTFLLLLAPFFCFSQIVLKGSLTSGNSGTDIWEYIDDATGNVYAIVGGNGMSVVDVTDPTNPTQVAHLTSVPGFDVKVWQNYVYCVNGGSGTASIVDISDPANPVIAGTFPSSHNIYIEERGYMYASSPGVTIYDLNANPLAPQQIASVGSEGHDVTIRGELMIDCHGYAGTFLYNVADPANPTLITAINDSDITYHHQGDISTDGNYLYICDELGNHPQADISVWDISNPAAPVRVSNVADPNATPHNMYVIDDYAYTSYYTAGLKIFDISDPSQLALADEYDTSSATGEGFAGAFGVYPSPETGNIYINDGSGVYVFGFEVLGQDELETATVSIYPNPAQGQVNIVSEEEPVKKVEVFSILGKRIMQVDLTSQLQSHTLDISALNSGVYFVKVNDKKAQRLMVK